MMLETHMGVIHMRLIDKLKTNNFYLASFLFIVILLISACSQTLSTSVKEGDFPSPDEWLRAEFWEFEGGVPVPVPAINPMTKEKVALGEKLFFDTRLSGNNEMSCISCHATDKGFMDGKKVATGKDGQELERNTPSLINAAFYREFNLDGSKSSLEEQSLIPITKSNEMDQNIDELVKELQDVPGYVDLFNKAFKDGLTAKNIGNALASFERTLIQVDTPFDQYMAGDDKALNAEEKWGMQLFATKGNCLSCHAGPTSSDNGYDNLNVDYENNDLGRYLVTGMKADIGAFRTPQLRNLKYTAPYMHDGSLETLEDVMDHYNEAPRDNINVSADFMPLRLNDEEEKAIIAFLNSMNSPEVLKIEPPKLPK